MSVYTPRTTQLFARWALPTVREDCMTGGLSDVVSVEMPDSGERKDDILALGDVFASKVSPAS